MTDLHLKTQVSDPELETAFGWFPIPDPENPGQYLDRKALFTQIRKAIRKLAGDWDMSGAVGTAKPSGSFALSCTVDASSDAAQTLTPVAPLLNASGAYIAAAGTPTFVGDGSCKFVQHAVDGGDNWIGVVWSFVDVKIESFSKLLSMQSSPQVGDFAFTAQFLPGAGIMFSVLNNGAGITSPTNTGITALAEGDSLYLIVDRVTGEISAQKNDDVAVLLGTIDFAEWPELRVFAGGIFVGATPVLNVGALTFDYASDDAGHTAMPMNQAAVLPEGAQEGDRFLVTAPGYFGTKTTKADDVVEIGVGTTDIHVQRYIKPADAVDAEAVAQLAQQIAITNLYPQWALHVAYRTVDQITDDPEQVNSIVNMVMCGAGWTGETGSPGDIVFKDSSAPSGYAVYYPAPGVLINFNVSLFRTLVMQRPEAVTPGDEPGITPALYDHALQAEISATNPANPYRWLVMHDFSSPGGRPYLRHEDPDGNVDVYDNDAELHRVVFTVAPDPGHEIRLRESKAGVPYAPSKVLDIVNQTAGPITVNLAGPAGVAPLQLTVAHYPYADRDETILRLRATATGWQYQSGAALAGAAFDYGLQGPLFERDVARVQIAGTTTELDLSGPSGTIMLFGGNAPNVLTLRCDLLSSTGFNTALVRQKILVGNLSTDSDITFDTSGISAVHGVLPKRTQNGMIITLTRYGSSLHVETSLSTETPHGATLHEDETAITMLKGQKVVVLRETSALGNVTVKLPPQPGLGDIVQIIRDGVTASDTIVQDSAAAAVQTVAAQADDTRLSYYFGFAVGSTTAAWRRLPAEA